jgi:undecaprenyl-diphosphatase
MKSQILKFDNEVIALFQRLPVSSTALFKFATFMGSGLVLTVIAGLVASKGFFLHRSDIILSSVACLVGAGVANLVKVAFRRERPLTAYLMQFNVITNYSFPSGHAAGSLLIYGYLAHLSMALIAAPWALAITSLLLAFVALIGISRVYLGAHFPTDVIGGWLLGGSLLLVVTSILHK